MKSHDNNSSAQQKTSQSYIDRRREARLPAHLPSILIQNDRTIYTTIINMSEHGIGFLSAVPLKSDDVIEINFERKSANTMIPVSLKVHVHSCQEVDFEYYIGGSIAKNSLEYKKFFETIEGDTPRALG
ncbi:PilZ domain-containing protein [Thiomicrorhabdus sediminis]|uniref:PilZ domain-containing protein n=1 Tax=Thiomicrorhabdus sediminis TaxID=2580412 RepID=A0A4V1HHJ5_9GAMM|nr:PilZ domain-containing protein [Thiomicrorhabdus sediminis]QCU89243.1 PilZ domain-containing protein [Thiomicrorhabdus sediminis]